MISRYRSPKIEDLWSDQTKVLMWQKVELAVIKARYLMGTLPADVANEISTALLRTPVVLDWWKTREKENGHDLQAFIDERVRFLSPTAQPIFHQGMTSYDTEEAAFAMILRMSVDCVVDVYSELISNLVELARKHRFTIMMGKTHGQGAEVQTLGKRFLSWLADLEVDKENLLRAQQNLKYSKLSGAIGNYGGITPELEVAALAQLGLKPFYGATQIMPRELYVPLAQALCQMVMTLNKIATAIRLGARSGRPIYQEPFGKKQKGSSRMPHKKNTIKTEQVEGMARMAQGYLLMIVQNIATWEERAIEQSCVERVAWPDLFHVVLHSFKVMSSVISGLQVYPDNMIREIIDSRGCYAAGEAKEFLREHLASLGVTVDHAYRIVQMAAFMAHSPSGIGAGLRSSPAKSFEESTTWLGRIASDDYRSVSIKEIIQSGILMVIPDLDVEEGMVHLWNELLKEFFSKPGNVAGWEKVFSIVDRLDGENKLYAKILND